MTAKFIDAEGDINTITQMQAELYSGKMSFDDYLNSALAIMHRLLKSHFADSYIFGKLYYVASYKPFNFQKINFFSDPINPDSEVYHNGLKEAEKLVDNASQLSLSVVLINGMLRGLMMYKAVNPPIEIPMFLVHNFSNDITESISSETIKSPVDKIALNIAIHKKMAESCQGDVFTYLLRTRNFDTDYNGSLFLVFKKRDGIDGIRVDEYSRIVDMFNHIMHAKLKHDYIASNNTEWRRIVEQVTHSSRNYYAFQMDRLSELEPFVATEGQEYLASVKILTEKLAHINNFFFALNKVNFSSRIFQSQKENVYLKEVLSISEFCLSDMFVEQFEALRKSIRSVSSSKLSYVEEILPFIAQKKVEVQERFQSIKLKAVQIGFSIVWFDMIKNAFNNLDPSEPLIQIDLVDFCLGQVEQRFWDLNGYNAPENGRYAALALTNNRPIVFMNTADNEEERGTYELMIGAGPQQGSVSSTTQLGLRIIGTVLKYDGMGVSGLPWFFAPSIECLNRRHTQTLLLIPKTDIVYGD